MSDKSAERAAKRRKLEEEKARLNALKDKEAKQNESAAQLERSKEDLLKVDVEALCMTMTTQNGTNGIYQRIRVFEVASLRGKPAVDRYLTDAQVKELKDHEKRELWLKLRHGCSYYSKVAVNETNCGTWPPEEPRNGSGGGGKPRSLSDKPVEKIPASPQQAHYELNMGPVNPQPELLQLVPHWRKEWSQVWEKIRAIEHELNSITFHIPNVVFDTPRLNALCAVIYAAKRQGAKSPIKPIIDAIEEYNATHDADLIGNRSADPDALRKFVVECQLYQQDEQLRKALDDAWVEAFVASAGSAINPAPKSCPPLHDKTDEPQQWTLRLRQKTHQPNDVAKDWQIRNYLAKKRNEAPEAVPPQLVTEMVAAQTRLADLMEPVVNTQWHSDKHVFSPLKLYLRGDGSEYICATYDYAAGKYVDCPNPDKFTSIRNASTDVAARQLADAARGGKWGPVKNRDAVDAKFLLTFAVGKKRRGLNFVLTEVFRTLEAPISRHVNVEDEHAGWSSGFAASRVQDTESLAEKEARIEDELRALNDEDEADDAQLDADLAAMEAEVAATEERLNGADADADAESEDVVESGGENDSASSTPPSPPAPRRGNVGKKRQRAMIDVDGDDV